MEALVRAGGVTPDASGEIVVLRPREGAELDGPLQPDQAGATEALRLDVQELQKGTGGNALVQNGDTVLVPRAETLFVIGHVRSPGSYRFKKGTTVLQAVSLAGGVTDRGALGRARIVRLVSGEKKEIRVEMTDIVQPDDTIVIPEKFF
jgi:polysaccharide export outer membrane protein